MKKNNPLVSVIMCEYNTEEKKLKKAIESILKQSYKNFELILVNDGSTTNVETIVKNFNDKRIKLFNNKKNMGFVYSLNKAIDNSRGDYLLRMDTDDISVENRLEILLNFMENNKQYAAVGSRALEFTDDDEIEDPTFNKKSYIIIGKKGEKTKKDIIHTNTVIHATALFDKNAIIKIGKYKNYKRCEDFVLWCDLYLNGYKTYSLSNVLYYYRVNPEDYKKRTLKKRKDSIKACFEYYPKLNASFFDYFHILKLIIVGILPQKPINYLRKIKHGGGKI